ncbi:low temperature requirement protein A [Dellaglioa algida]|uniref:low temperature requirement protein A n=1 Tax=Dellaglioa algida TaxID=105612 RepID=UPI000BCFB974|nr:low temperature requirement protein A [Dellaglioa algida]MDK1719057.1 low temperature requirement protein A [Dellaglioa algida]MDK1730233.1 low temperature requirement protein A [Dellaglioa algida]MDK1742636.1 low temperature requirement protein A [Dellaglioa algida]SOB51662.1 Bacterial low temperature requirement A family protein [Dellaglioa algida]
MAEKIFKKKVELPELFYDLVFAYAISQTTDLLYHFKGNLASVAEAFIIFSVVMVVFINTWMIKSVFINRYGKNSIADIILFMIDVAILLYMSNAFKGNIQDWFQPFAIATGLLSTVLVVQYGTVYLTSKKSADKRISRLMMTITAARTVLVFIGAFLPIKFGIPVALIGIAISWVLPGLFGSILKLHALNFPHILERLTLLTIITFGETIVGIASYFTVETFNFYSILIFTIVGALFMTYITQMDHYIDENRSDETGIRLIYVHYFILFGISLVTVSLEFIGESHIPKNFAILSLYLGLSLFYLGLFLTSPYNKKQLNSDKQVIVFFTISTIIGLLVSLMFNQFSVVVITTALIAVINSIVYVRYMIIKTRL